MKKLLLALVFTLVAFPVYAYELLMFSNPECQWCQQFMEEVEPEYHGQNIYARKLPLRIIITKGPPPQWFQDAVDKRNIAPIESIPTFVVWDGNKEMARLTGYRGKDGFYRDLHDYIVSNEALFGKLEGPIPPRQAPQQRQEEGSHMKLDKFPNGVYKSRDLMDHIYDTETEAQIAAQFLGCAPDVHTHTMNGKTIWMPCKME
jgi:hypothetical protein